MRLSEAIRLGSMLKPQGFGLNRSSKQACALDAAALALGDYVAAQSHAIIYEKFPILNGPAVCPVCGHEPLCKPFLGRVIASHLNDTHRWTREQIADWIEQTYEQPPKTEKVEDTEYATV